MAIPSNAHLIWHPFIGACMHDYLTPLPALPIAPMSWWFIDFGIVHGVTGLFALPTAKFPYPPAVRPSHGEILDMGVPMEAHGTDAGPIVIHVPVPPNYNWLLLLIILLGSSKILMASNRTRIWCKGLLSGDTEEAVGCCVFPYVPFSLNLQCWDVKGTRVGEGLSVGAPMPTDLVIAPNTVQVGINWSDYLAALIEWAIEIVIAVVLALGAKGGAAAWEKRSAKKIKKAGDKAEKEALKRAQKKGLGNRVGKRIARDAREQAEARAAKPGTLGKLYHKIADTRYGKKYLIAFGTTIPYKLVSKTEWYRDQRQKLQVV